MKRFFPVLFVLLAACDIEPHISPEPGPLDASVSDATNSSSSSSLASSSSSASSASSSSSGEVQGDGSGARLKRYIYTSADGLAAGRINQFYDSLLGIDCSPQPTPLGSRCMPAQIAGIAWYSDPQCTKPTAYVNKQCALHKYAFHYGPLVCGQVGEARFYTTTQTTVQAVYADNGSGCKDVTATTLLTYDVYELGPEVDYAQFAAMTLEHE